MSALTIQEAAADTGWSPRMLRYIEQHGLVQPDRSVSGYRLYRPDHLARLRSLRALIDTFGIALSDVAFAQRLRREPRLGDAIGSWLADRPEADTAWLRVEQEKHQRLLRSKPTNIQDRESA